jgi:hypothetical protein
MAIIHPDVEKLLVAYLVTALAAIDDPVAEDVRVATKKTPPGETQPDKEVVVIAQYDGTLDEVRKSATAVLDVWASGYEVASELALLVAALIVNFPGSEVKRAVVSLGPVRLSEDGPLERRSLTVDLIVKGSEL